MAVPSKIIGIMAAGIPVIALVPEKSEIAYIINEEKCGYVVSPEDVDGLLRAVEELKNNEGLRKEMGENGRKAFENKYTSKIVAKSYKRLITTKL
jgi:glycosyltransferase involved in cell wall biosynthesis